MSINFDYFKYDESTGDFLPIDEKARKKNLERQKEHQENIDKLAEKEAKMKRCSKQVFDDFECQKIIKKALSEQRPLNVEESIKIHYIINIERFKLHQALQKRR